MQAPEGLVAAQCLTVVETNEQVANLNMVTEINIVENHFEEHRETIPKRLEISAPPVESVTRMDEAVTERRSERQAVVEDFRPLTLEQLKSLYYNIMLDNNTAYIDRFVQVRQIFSGNTGGGWGRRKVLSGVM